MRVATFTVVFLAVYCYVVVALSNIAGEKARVEKEKAAFIGGAVEATPEAGENIFWGKGACHTCHSIGGRGSAIRGPNLGESGPLGLPIGARAMKRAEERTKQTGKTYSPTDYLVESLMEPDVYLVEGFSKLMPVAWRPPIALRPDAIRAVITYLQSTGGSADLASIDQSPFFSQLQALASSGKAQGSAAAAPKLLVSGEAEAGRELFFNADSPAACAKCHRVGDKGGNVGPELTNIAAAQPLEYLIESILEPNKVIVKGFEPVMVQMKGGQLLTGVIKKESSEMIEIGDSQGQTQKIAKGEIVERVPQKTSLMPGNFSDILTVKDFHDLLAYLQTLK
ncbi:MAG: c-type cytochrome [Deltaproteobacteria bacterium]|nr:c-type cytochrome [Deltaproteobacteria bacterium]